MSARATIPTVWLRAEASTLHRKASNGTGDGFSKGRFSTRPWGLSRASAQGLPTDCSAWNGRKGGLDVRYYSSA